MNTLTSEASAFVTYLDASGKKQMWRRFGLTFEQEMRLARRIEESATATYACINRPGEYITEYRASTGWATKEAA